MNCFYSLKKEEIFKQLNSSENGLTDYEARERLKRYGKNFIKEKDKRSILEIFISQFKSPLILILIFATILAFALGEHIDAFVILGIILISGLLGFYQEYKSDKALVALKKYISFKTKVIRNNQKTQIDVQELVPGDIVLLRLGDIVPADLRVIESEELYANESFITGESYPVKKIDSEIEGENLPLSKQSNMLFMGSEISSGICKAIVVSTGEQTAFGKTANILSAKTPPSNFQIGVNNFGKFLIKLVFVLTIFVFATNFLLGKGLFDSFLFAIALAVGVTPELLPVIMTIAMSRGALKMAEKKVVVKKLVSIEDLGNMDVLCCDKTGTLTENNVSLIDYFDTNNNKNQRLIEYAAMCNSSITHKHKVVGNPLDKAIIEFIEKNNIAIPKYERIEDIEFDHNRRRMSSVVKLGNKNLLICKGGVLSILSISSKINSNDKILPIKRYSKKIQAKYEELSKKGFRVIALAYKEINNKKNYTIADETDLIFLGFLVFIDPPKKDVKTSLEKFKQLGVEVKILTGDNEIVTEEICKEVGFEIKGKIFIGEEIEKLEESKFLKIIEENNVFARLTPDQKLKIVDGLKKNRHITGFLGDGVNDAPSLKNADVGITVDSAVDVAKNSADIILLRKSLGVICDGIIEGRKTFGNSTKYILNTISANFGNMFSLSVASLYFKFIPLLPKQILLTNFISDMPLLTISNDNVDEDYLKKPKKWNIKMIRRFMIFFGLISSIFDIITMALVWFLIAPANPTAFRTVWFTESVLSEIFVTFAIRTNKPFWKSKPSKLLVIASLFGVALTLIVVLSSIKGWFDFADITIITLAIIFSILLSYFILVEFGKKIFYSRIEKEN